MVNYTSNTSFAATKFSDRTDTLLGKDVFSYEVIEASSFDLAATPEYAYTLLEARLSTDEGNVMFIANAEDTSTEYKDENGQVYYKTYLENFAGGGFSSYMTDLSMDGENSYFQKLERYLSRFYDDWTDKTTLDKNKVQTEFLERAKKNKDKRYKTDEQKSKGIKQDIERIEKYRDGLENFYSYIESEYISITTIETEYAVSEMQTKKINRYAVNLCPNEETMGKLKEIVNYELFYEDEEGNKKKKPTAKDMHLILFDLKGVEEGFQYESLLFVNNLVELYCTALQK